MCVQGFDFRNLADVEIVCPDGCGPGDTITVDTPAGEVDVEIPDGVEAGDAFSIELQVPKQSGEDASSANGEPGPAPEPTATQVRAASSLAGSSKHRRSELCVSDCLFKLK